MDINTKKLAKYVVVEVTIFIALILLIIFRNLYGEVLLQFAPFVNTLFNLIPSLITILFVLLTTHFIITILKAPFQAGLNRVLKSEADVKMIWQLLTYTVWFIVMVLLIFMFIPNLSGALITFGVVVAALAYVLQKPILNIGGWFAIVFRQPYKIGDRISVNEVHGYVIEITVFYTVVREFAGWMTGDTYTGRLISIPNSYLFDFPISNYTKDTPFIWDEVQVSITYESDHEMAKRIMMESAKEIVGDFMEKYHDYVLKKMELSELEQDIVDEPQIRMKFAPSSMDMAVVYFCQASRRRDIHSQISERVLSKISRTKEVNVAYPHIQWVPHTESKKV